MHRSFELDAHRRRDGHDSARACVLEDALDPTNELRSRGRRFVALHRLNQALRRPASLFPSPSFLLGENQVF